MAKEADEEAGIPAWLVGGAKSCGTVSFVRESSRGVHANTEFVYDLQLPIDFKPTNRDGEVDGFELVSVKVKLYTYSNRQFLVLVIFKDSKELK